LTFLTPKSFRNGTLIGSASPTNASNAVRRPAPRDFISVEEYATPSATATEDHTSAIQTAFGDAKRRGKGLYFPPGRWNTTLHLDVPERIEIAGAGLPSDIRYSGSGAFLRGEFTSAADSEFTWIHDLQIRGTNAAGQSGIVMGTNLQGVARTKIEGVLVEDFAQGYGIFLQRPADCEVARCRIGAAQYGIVMHTAAGCTARLNYMSYFGVFGIHFYSVDSALAPRNNKIEQNLIHGNGVIAQASLQDRAAIRLDRTSSTDIVNNYIEIIKAPPGATSQVGHGIWLKSSELTQGNSVEKNYFGPGTTGDAVRLEGLTSHTDIRANMVGTYNIHDSGLYTAFHLQHLPSMAQLTGTSTTRTGWIKHLSTLTQLHA
jgi:hypothetical protein